MSFTLQRFEHSDQLVAHTADAFVAWIQSRSRLSPRSSVAFGGGRVFRRFLEATANRLRVDRTGLDRLDFFWGDERCVPPDHAESNYRLASESFFQPLTVSREQIHRLRGEAVPLEAAKSAEVILRTATNCAAPEVPALDLVFLGMGEDGHVASLFPGASEEVTETPRLFLPVMGPKPPPQRLTMSFRMLAAAHEVWVIASGAGKEVALRESTRPGGSTPLARVLAERASTLLLTDIPAEVA